jgi:hypothetical protein
VSLRAPIGLSSCTCNQNQSEVCSFIRVCADCVGDPTRSAICALCATRLPRSCPSRHSSDSNAFLCARLSQSTISSRFPNRTCLALHSCWLWLWNSAPRKMIVRCPAALARLFVCGVCPIISLWNVSGLALHDQMRLCLLLDITHDCVSWAIGIPALCGRLARALVFPCRLGW